MSPVERRGAPPGDRRKIETGALLQLAAAAASEVKPSSLIHLDLRGICTFTDHFLIAGASSVRQMRAIAERIEERLSGEQVRLFHREGDQKSGWILLDYSDFIVHIFDETTRVYYDLEGLWADAPKQELVRSASQGPLR